jgi:DNA-binding transcriptional ArsR family regulator
MPHRVLVTKQLGTLLGVLSHPHRLRIIEELGQGEQDVNALQALLGISHSGVSQHLSLLRAHHVVEERREGRRVIYNLVRPELAVWLVEGLQFIRPGAEEMKGLDAAVRKARSDWGSAEPRVSPRKDRSS